MVIRKWCRSVAADNVTQMKGDSTMPEANDSRVTGAPEPAQPESGASGTRGWISGVFLEPGSTFSSIAASVDRPHPKEPGRTKDMSKWWLPLLISIVIAVGISLYTVPTYVAPMQADAIREAVMQRGGSEADVEQAIAMSGAMLIPMSIVGVVVVTFIILFVSAGIAHLLMKMVGGKGLFRHSRAVVAWSLLVPALGSLIKLPLMIVRKSMIVETSPTLFIPKLEPSDRLFKFLSSFDIFTIWWMIVLLIGLSVAYRTSRIVVTVLSPGGMGAGM
jgi:hypothetical protein